MVNIFLDSEANLLSRIAQKKLNRNGENARIKALIDTIHNPEMLGVVWKELGMAVDLLNKHVAGEEIQTDNPVVLNYANDMKEAMEKHNIASLPSPDQILQQAREANSLDIVRSLLDVFGKTKDYKFLTDFETKQAMCGEAMAVYGKLLLELHPELKSEKVYGASTLEEMFAVLKFNGEDTECFEACKPWFAEEVEGGAGIEIGFSQTLVEKVNKILII